MEEARAHLSLLCCHLQVLSVNGTNANLCTKQYSLESVETQYMQFLFSLRGGLTDLLSWKPVNLPDPDNTTAVTSHT